MLKIEKERLKKAYVVKIWREMQFLLPKICVAWSHKLVLQPLHVRKLNVALQIALKISNEVLSHQKTSIQQIEMKIRYDDSLCIFLFSISNLSLFRIVSFILLYMSRHMSNCGENILVQMLLFWLRIYLNICLRTCQSPTCLFLHFYLYISLWRKINVTKFLPSNPKQPMEKLNVNGKRKKMKFVCIVIFEIFLKKVSKGWLVFLTYNKTLKFRFKKGFENHIYSYMCTKHIFPQGKIIFHIFELK